MKTCSWYYYPVGIFLVAALATAGILPYGEEILFLNDLRFEPFNTAFRVITVFGEPFMWVLAGVFFLFRARSMAFPVIVAGLLIIPVSYIIKDKAGTDRPCTHFQNIGKSDQVVVVPGVALNKGKTSFPSGHTMSAFGLYSMLALLSRGKNRYLLMTLAGFSILVGVSRIFLVQHFLVDVIGGAVLGMLISILVWKVWDNKKPGTSEKIRVSDI
ncbi:MAG: phosphatase PAP2 family protein [Bacteroidota bacterium]|jgi:membrane-associated phospholipid phosphatase|nr:phosphatase PAP2 family protein [Saprospiraceae bacterium]